MSDTKIDTKRAKRSQNHLSNRISIGILIAASISRYPFYLPNPSNYLTKTPRSLNSTLTHNKKMRDPSVRQTAMIALAIVMIAVPQLPEQDLDEAVLSMQTLVFKRLMSAIAP